MSSPTLDWTAVVERLEKLERQNRRMKQACAAVLILAAAVLLMGQASPNRTVEANEFLLIDRKGRTLAELATTEDALELPIMRFYGVEPLAESGTVLRMTIGAVPDPQIVVYHAFGPLESGGNDRLMSLSFPFNDPRCHRKEATVFCA